jgi:hypothetical protein
LVELVEGAIGDCLVISDGWQEDGLRLSRLGQRCGGCGSRGGGGLTKHQRDGNDGSKGKEKRQGNAKSSKAGIEEAD